MESLIDWFQAMKSMMSKTFFLALILLAALLACPARVSSAEAPKVRQPAVAGAFYPADAKELTGMIDGFLAKASVPQIAATPMVIISPHAGYPYSGPVAAYAYALLRGKKFERVVVIAPSHYESFPFSSIYNGDAYSTPLGTLPVDKGFAAQLAGLSPLIKISGEGHGEVQGHGEHALEVELPFLQRVLGEFKLVPIVMGSQDYEACRALGVSLAKMLGSKKPGAPSPANTLIVVSSDLSHYHPYDEAVKIDHQTLKAIEEWDYLSLWRNFASRVWEACGGGPIVAAMMAAERLGAHRAEVLKYANSGDTTGDKSRVVGYGAVALYAGQPESRKEPAEFSLSGREKQELLRIARQSVETAVKEHKLYQPPASGLEHLGEARGAFVTLKERGELRGCIGYITPIKSLAETVRDVAALAALEDRRFRPVSVAELGQLQYEVSVLSPLHHVTDIKQIKVGKHGLIIKKGETEGLLLPQVPVEQGWNRNTFLDQTSVKAGLPPGAWQDEDTDLFLFTAVVFGEPVAPQAVMPPERDPLRLDRRPGLPGQDLPQP